MISAEILLKQLDTPALVIDGAALEANLTAMQHAADHGGKKLRPHIKTHKSVHIAGRQLELGAVGITTAKLGEAEVFAAAGVLNIFIAGQITHPEKRKRLAELHRKIHIITGIDHPWQIEFLAEQFRDNDHPLPLRIEINTGHNRCGVEPRDAVRLATLVDASPGLILDGIFTHAGHVYGAAASAEISTITERELELMREARREIEKNGIAVSCVSVGSTPAAALHAAAEGIDEMRPGNYVFNDNMQYALGSCRSESRALYVLATVISRPADDRVVIDAGSKALGLDRGAHGLEMMSGFGEPVDRSALVERLSEEHGILRVAPDCTLQPGDPLLLYPNHACAVANLFDFYYLYGPDGILKKINVDARGRSQ
jgi:D-serine deaminase-like pyridoxal phosphate-dependent protein